MYRSLSRIIRLALVSIFAVACAAQPEKIESTGGMVKTNFVPDYDIIGNQSSIGDDINLDQLIKPSVEDFNFVISAPDAEFSQNYTYSQIAKGVQLPIGRYSMMSYYGDDMPSGWNNVRYEASQEFVLTHSISEVEVALKAKVKSAMAIAKFDDNFRSMFKDISVEFRTKHMSDSLLWEDNEQRIACFRESDELLVVVNVTKKANNKSYSYGVEPVSGFVGGTVHVLNFTVKNGDAMVNITMDNGVTIKNESAMLDPDWMKYRQTKIMSSNATGNLVENMDGLSYDKALNYVITSNVGLRSVALEFGELLTNQYGYNRIELLNPSEHEQALIDGVLGIRFDGSEATGNYVLGMKAIVNKCTLQNNAATSYDYQIVCEDKFGVKTQRRDTIIITPIPFVRKDQDQGLVWSRFAMVPGTELVGVDPAEHSKYKIEYWIKRKQDLDWRSLGVIDGAGDIYVNGLDPRTTYCTRISYLDYNFFEQEFTTAAEQVLANGDFEDFANFSYADKPNRVGAEFGGAWATLNALTTINRMDENYFKSYPCVMSAPGRNGNGVEIRTVGWGGASNYKHFVNAVNTKWFERSVEKATAGKLFLGTYAYEPSSEEAGQVHGVAFASRPVSLDFWYKYTKHKENQMQVWVELLSNDIVVAGGEFLSNQAVDAYTKCTVPITYLKAHLNLPVTSIRLWFTSSNQAVNKDTDLNYNDGTIRASWAAAQTRSVDVWDAFWYGNSLFVDDVSLNYPQEYSEYTIAE